MENTNCNLCGMKQEKLLFLTKDKNWLIEGDFSLVRCRNCGLVYVNPRPDENEIKKYYPDPYHLRRGGAVFNQEYINVMERSFSARFKLFQRFKKNGRLLEIGCGDGFFLKYLKENGWEVYGLDTSEYAVSVAKEKVGESTIFRGQLQEAKYPNEFFDTVCLFEVLEHVPDPARVLKEINRILKADGILVITLPNFASLERVILGDNWYALDAPRHLFHFTKNTLRLLLKKAGFKTVQLKAVNSHHIQEVGATTGYSEGIRHRLRDFGLYPTRVIPKDIQEIRVKQDGNFLKKLLHLFEKTFFYPLVLVAGILQKGGALIAVARKQP